MNTGRELSHLQDGNNSINDDHFHCSGQHCARSFFLMLTATKVKTVITSHSQVKKLRPGDFR